MNLNEIGKSKAFCISQIIEYVANSVVIKSILNKPTGNICVMSFDSGEGQAARISPFDIFTQIIEGQVQILINDESNLLTTGQSVVIPANAAYSVKSNGRFKMIQTIIKSGYE